MKRATRNAEKTRQEIIEKSAPVFNTHGFAGTKMQMLVDATGFQMGGIYRHFDTKKDLAKAAFSFSYSAQVRQNLEVDPQLNPKQQLQSIFENYKKMVLKPRIAGGCPLLNTATEVDDTDEEFRLMTKSYVQEVISTMEEILEEGKTSGHFKSHIDPRKEAQFLFASVQGAIMVCTVTKSVKVLFDIFEQVDGYLEKCVFS